MTYLTPAANHCFNIWTYFNEREIFHLPWISGHFKLSKWMIEPLRLFCIHFRKQVKFEDTQGSELLSIFESHPSQAGHSTVFPHFSERGRYYITNSLLYNCVTWSWKNERWCVLCFYLMWLSSSWETPFLCSCSVKVWWALWAITLPVCFLCFQETHFHSCFASSRR